MSSVVRRWSIALAITFSAPLVTSAQTEKVAPLLDRELFFGNPEISGAQISPDGRYVSFLKPYKDTRNVWVKRAGDPYSAAKLITNDTKRPVTQYFWSRDGKYILFAQDHLGDENFNVYAVDPAASPPTGQEVPAARNLTAATGVRAVIYDRPKNDPDIMYVGINDRDKAWHDLYKVRISTGQKALLRKNTERIAGWQFDNAGNLRLARNPQDVRKLVIDVGKHAGHGNCRTPVGRLENPGQRPKTHPAPARGRIAHHPVEYQARLRDAVGPHGVGARH